MSLTRWQIAHDKGEKAMTENTFLRLKEIEIHNFMGVQYGKIRFSSGTEDYQKNRWNANVIGIYGPNGSGKSTLFHAISLLKEILRDEDAKTQKLLQPFKSGQGFRMVRSGCDYATLSFSFYINTPETELTYSFRLKNNSGLIEIDDEEFNVAGKKKLYMSCHNLEGNYMKREALVTAVTGIRKDSSGFKDDLKKVREIWRTAEKDHSLIREIGNVLGYRTEEMKTFALFRKEILSIRIFNEDDMNCLRSPKYSAFLAEIAKKNGDVIRLTLAADGKIEAVKHEDVDIDDLKDMKRKINIIMSSMIDGLSIDFISKEDSLYLVLKKDELPVPYEQASYGFRKLLAISLSFIDLFRSPSTMIFFDELDEGIFEYLFGKIIKTVNEYAQGQLVFTAHNLRPLETLPFSSIRFTFPAGSNPTGKQINQYRGITNLNKASDLRSVYLREAMKTDFRNELMKVLLTGKTPDEIISYFDTYVDSLVPRTKVLVSNLMNTVSEVQDELERANQEKEGLAIALNDAYALLEELACRNNEK